MHRTHANVRHATAFGDVIGVAPPDTSSQGGSHRSTTRERRSCGPRTAHWDPDAAQMTSASRRPDRFDMTRRASRRTVGRRLWRLRLRWTSRSPADGGTIDALMRRGHGSVPRSMDNIADRRRTRAHPDPEGTGSYGRILQSEDLLATPIARRHAARRSREADPGPDRDPVRHGLPRRTTRRRRGDRRCVADVERPGWFIGRSDSGRRRRRPRAVAGRPVHAIYNADIDPTVCASAATGTRRAVVRGAWTNRRIGSTGVGRANPMRQAHACNRPGRRTATRRAPPTPPSRHR